MLEKIKNIFRKSDKPSEVDVETLLKEEAITSPAKQIVKRFFQNKLGVIGLVGFLAIVLTVFIGSSLLKYDAYYSQGVMKNIGTGSGYMNIPNQLEKEGIKKIDIGTTFSIGLSKENNFFVWGYYEPQLGEVPEAATAVQGKVKDIAAGDKHVLILTEDNKIIGWGDNAHGQIEHPTDFDKLIEEEGISYIGAGDLYSVLLTDKGTFKAWGATLPTNLHRISTAYNQNIAYVEEGSVDVLALTKDGRVVVLGQKGSELDTALPEEIGRNGTVKIVEIGRMRYSGAAVDENGKLYTWGSSLDGANKAPEIDGKVIKLESGRESIVALTDTGKVYAWGNNNYGTLDYPKDDGYKNIFAGFFNNYAIKESDTGETQSVSTWGLDGFIMGSDEQGRDLFTRLVNGGKMTLLIALVAVVIQIVIGVTVGVVAGFYGGVVDNILMRFAEVVASFPFYPLIITISALLPVDTSQYTRLIMIMFILGILNWTGIARLVRGEILSERQKDYITAAKALGLKESKIMASHMVPNIISIIIVQATLGYAGSLLSEAGLSFLGFGVKDPFPSWGNMLSKANEVAVLETYWWRWVFPGLSVFLTALTVNFIGDALRDAMDPKALER
ncbi:MAG: ABC transporter permease subunit [Tissierellia bacterium]|nr:ABC transporter permease subunit [Tissierellia bacterium]